MDPISTAKKMPAFKKRFRITALSLSTQRSEFSSPQPPRVKVRWPEVLGEVFVHIATIRNLDDVHNEFVILDFIENP